MSRVLTASKKFFIPPTSQATITNIKLVQLHDELHKVEEPEPQVHGLRVSAGVSGIRFSSVDDSPYPYPHRFTEELRSCQSVKVEGPLYAVLKMKKEVPQETAKCGTKKVREILYC